MISLLNPVTYLFQLPPFPTGNQSITITYPQRWDWYQIFNRSHEICLCIWKGSGLGEMSELASNIACLGCGLDLPFASSISMFTCENDGEGWDVSSICIHWHKQREASSSPPNSVAIILCPKTSWGMYFPHTRALFPSLASCLPFFLPLPQSQWDGWPEGCWRTPHNLPESDDMTVNQDL